MSDNKPQIAYYGYSGPFGLAEATRSNQIALRQAGWKVGQAKANEYGPDADEIDDIVNIHHWHPKVLPNKQHENYFAKNKPSKRIWYWAWEMEDILHEGMKRYAHFADEIWCPSTFCKKLFDPLGIPVKVVPHAVRVGYWKAPARKRGELLSILSPFDAWSRFGRKNPSGAVDAFQLAFPRGNEKARLIMKTNNASGEELNSLQRMTDDPRIVFTNQFMDEIEWQRYFAQHHCLLSMHRSEGFGLNLARALLTGLHLVCTNYGGCVDWLDFAHRVNWCSTQFEGDPCYPKGGRWAEPDVYSAARHLQHIYEAPEEIERIRQAAMNDPRFSFETIGNRMTALLLNDHSRSISYPSPYNPPYAPYPSYPYAA